MGQTKISELKKLANQSELVSSLAYSNPNRNKGLVYDFVRLYGDKIGVTITEEEIGFMDERRSELRNIRVCRTNSSMPLSERLACGVLDGLGLLLSPLTYPIFGATDQITNDGDELIIGVPSYSGVSNIIFGSLKPHEYLHAYHKIAAKDLKQRGLLPNIDGYEDIGLMEPQVRVPTFEELKHFEKKFLKAMIREEMKHI